jgi:phosphohistidine phosphatase SixA
MKPAFFLMRHGDAGATLPDEAQNRARHLTPAGRSEALSASNKLANKRKQPTAVYHDVDARCTETAKIVADTFGFQPIPDARLAHHETTRQAILDHTGGSARPLMVTHDHVIGLLENDPGNDWPVPAEIRRMHGKKEKRRIKP